MYPNTTRPLTRNPSSGVNTNNNQSIYANQKQQPSSSSSPIKIKDYFINPLHRIKQPCFTQIGFTQSHLHTFVKSFTNRSYPLYISLASIKKFIQSFTNNNIKLMSSYQQFFINNFQMKKLDGQNNILLEEFLEFFLKQTERKVGWFSQSEWKTVYEKALKPLNVKNIMQKAKELQVPMTKEEAANIVKMINVNAGIQAKQTQIKYEAFIKAMMK